MGGGGGGGAREVTEKMRGAGRWGWEEGDRDRETITLADTKDKEDRETDRQTRKTVVPAAEAWLRAT